MPDILMTFGDFSKTDVEVAALTPAAKATFAERFGAGAVGASLRKSFAPAFVEFCEGCGLTVAVE